MKLIYRNSNQYTRVNCSSIKGTHKKSLLYRKRYPFYMGISVDIEGLSFDSNLNQWLPENLEGRRSWGGIEDGVRSVKAFKRYLKKNKHNFPSYTKVTLVSRYRDCEVIGYIKSK